MDNHVRSCKFLTSFFTRVGSSEWVVCGHGVRVWARVSAKAGLWTLDWTMDWTMDWNMDSILDSFSSF